MTNREHVQRLLLALKEKHDHNQAHARVWQDRSDDAGSRGHVELEAHYLYLQNVCEARALVYRKMAILLAAEFDIVVLAADPFTMTEIDPKELQMGRIDIPSEW